VAALPGRVIVPSLPEQPSEAEVARHRQLSQIALEQRTQAEAHRIATDPAEIKRREHIARIRLGRLDAAIAHFEAQRADLLARHPGLAS
jgi:hypothetical protein